VIHSDSILKIDGIEVGLEEKSIEEGSSAVQVVKVGKGNVCRRNVHDNSWAKAVCEGGGEGRRGRPSMVFLRVFNSSRARFHCLSEARGYQNY
jgi:hypothetical protein